MMINPTGNAVADNRQTLVGIRNSAISNENSRIKQGPSQNMIGRSHDESEVSTLANQLSEASLRAQARDARLSREELSAMARNIFNELESPYYTANKSKHDSEIPDSEDAALLARAESATLYTRGLGSNPFSGMPMDQLALITYDDNGTFTINERRAALEESGKQEFAWRQKVVAQAEFEYNTTGKLTKFFKSVLDHYQGLPLIEQAEYPSDYESRLNKSIILDFNYINHVAESKSKFDFENFTMKILGRDNKFFTPNTLTINRFDPTHFKESTRSEIGA